MSAEALAYAWDVDVPDGMMRLALLFICNIEHDGVSVVKPARLAEFCAVAEDDVGELIADLCDARLIFVTPQPWGDIEVCIPAMMARAPRGETDPGVKFSVRMEVYRRDGMSCHYCGCELDRDSATLDHVIPRSRGGNHDADNLVVCCQPCNSSKRDRTPEEWAKWKGRAA